MKCILLPGVSSVPLQLSELCDGDDIGSEGQLDGWVVPVGGEVLCGCFYECKWRDCYLDPPLWPPCWPPCLHSQMSSMVKEGQFDQLCLTPLLDRVQGQHFCTIANLWWWFTLVQRSALSVGGSLFGFLPVPGLLFLGVP
jgi:hypothetical protein